MIAVAAQNASTTNVGVIASGFFISSDIGVNLDVVGRLSSEAISLAGIGIVIAEGIHEFFFVHGVEGLALSV